MNLLFKNKNYNIAFLSSFLLGIFTHLYAMVNPIFNDDAIKVRNAGMYPGGGSQGRWMAEIISDLTIKLGYTITVPFFAFLTCIIMLSFISVMIVKMLKIKNSIIVVLISSLIVTSTSIIQLLSYDYVCQSSVLSILFTIFACCIIHDVNLDNYKNINLLLKTIFGVVLFTIAIGIYQISIPIYFSILISVLINDYIFYKKRFNEVIKKGLYFIIVSIIAILLYIVLNKFINLYLYHRVFDGGHYGMTENVIPKYSFELIKELLTKCIAVPVILPFINYAGINTTLYSKILVLSIYIMFLYLLIFATKKMRPLELLFTLFLLLLFIISVNMQRIIITQSIQTRMTFSLMFIFILPLVFIDNINFNVSNKISKIITILYTLLILHFIFVANANYYTAHIKNMSIRNLCNQIVSKIINVDGFNQDLPVIFIGGGINNKNFIRYDYNENNLSDQYIFNPEYLFEVEARENAFKVFANFTYKLPEVLILNNANEIPNNENVFYKIGKYGLTYSNNSVIKNMPCYPDDGSVKIIDGVVVVKISN